MPMLAIDSMGNLYETDPDSYDGSGCKCAPPKVSGGDVTLGRAYQDGETRRIRNEVKLQTALALQDHMDLKTARIRNQAHHLSSVANERREFLNGNPLNQLRLTKLGGRQSLQGSQDRISISGFGLSSNGLPGEYKNQQQLGAEIAVTGGPVSQGTPAAVTPKSFWSLFSKKPATAAVAKPTAPIFRASDTEFKQYALNQKYKMIALKQAKADAKRVTAEARDAGFDPSSDEDAVLYNEQSQGSKRRPAVINSKNVNNPLLKMVRGF